MSFVRSRSTICAILALAAASPFASAQLLPSTAAAPTPWQASFFLSTPDPTPRLGPSAPETLNQIIDRVALESPDPVRRRDSLLARVVMSNSCFAPTMTAEQLAEVIRTWDDLPDSVTGPRGPFVPRFELAPFTYAGAGNIAPSGQCTPASLTYSFAPDGVHWGLEAGRQAPCDLNTRMLAVFPNIDVAREYIRQAIAPWRKWCGLTYTEVTDDARPWDKLPGRFSGVGDVRIGGGYTVAPGYVAYNHFPADGSNMFIDTYRFTPADPFFSNAAGTYHNLRSMVTHEHGHGLGNFHSNPCDATKIMEPILSSFESLGIDDIRGGHRNFGDRFSGNHTPATAKDLGDITAGPAVGGGRSIRLLNLSTNGALSPTNPAGADWFKISSSVTGRGLVVRVKPKGGTYLSGPQVTVGSNLCTGAGSSIVAQQAGDLRVDFYVDPNGAPSFSSAAGGPGVDEALGITLGTGTRYIKVTDTGPNAAPNQTVQLYDLEILINSVPSEPMACAGISKIAHVGEPCYFLPAINSQTTEPGATITAYQYDLDGDGIFETSGSIGLITYTTPGVRNVTIRVIDSNNKSSDDTIQVNVLSQDDCLGATPIYANQTLSGSTAGATADPGALHACVGGAENGVWYRYIPAATGLHSISTCQASLDTVVSIFSGDCATGLTSIGCNDDDQAICPTSIRASNITGLMLTAGVPYYIKVSGYLNASGSFGITVNLPGTLGSCCSLAGTCVSSDQSGCTGSNMWTSGAACGTYLCALPNDACANQFPLTLNTVATGSTASLTASDPDQFSCFYGAGRSVWFSFTPPRAARYKISTCGSSFYTMLNVFATANCADPTTVACGGSDTTFCPTNSANAFVNSVLLTPVPHRICLGGALVSPAVWDAGTYTIVVRCLADFDDSGQLAVADIFAFLNAWFAGSTSADTDASGTLAVADIFEFLNSWFAGCS